MKIQVTQEDIDNGIPMEPCACPVARALERQTGKRFNITGYVAYEFGSDQEPYSLPHYVRDFIILFDYNKTRSQCKPFEFELPI